MTISKHYPFINIKAVTVKIWLNNKPIVTKITARTIARTITALTEAQGRGITAQEMSSWAFRLGAYVHILKRDYGLDIETLKEKHKHGWHGRYVLHTRIEIIEAITD